MEIFICLELFLFVFIYYGYFFYGWHLMEWGLKQMKEKRLPFFSGQMVQSILDDLPVFNFFLSKKFIRINVKENIKY